MGNEQIPNDAEATTAQSAFDPQVSTNDSPDSEIVAADVPTEAGRYVIDGEVARGGMGAVLRARDPDFDRTLAVKIMLGRHGNRPDLDTRFFEEAQITGQLQHPGIPPVHELGRLPDERPFFAMKLIEGETLDQLLKVRENPSANLARFLSIFEQICQTIAYAHSQNVIHRDLKPLNVMVGSFGEVQVMDWGLAKKGVGSRESGIQRESRSHRSSDVADRADGSLEPIPNAQIGATVAWEQSDFPLTQAGQVMGTPAFMAPEQARGEVEQIDERCDVFGLGGILCVILTGNPPYVGDSVSDTHRRAVEAELGDAWRRLEECPADGDLKALARRCLEPDLSKRIRDARGVAEEVTSHLESVQARLRQAEVERAQAQVKAEEERKRREVEEARSDEERKRRQAEEAKTVEERKRRRTTLALAASVLLLISGIGGAAFLYQQLQHQQAIDAAKRKAAEEHRVDLTEQEIRQSLNEAHRIRGKLHAALAKPGGVFRFLDDASGWRSQIMAARAALEQASALLTGVEGKIDADLREQIRQLTSKLQQDETDYTLALHLEEVRLSRYIFVGGKLDFTKAHLAYPTAFKKAGLEFSKLDESTLAEVLTKSRIKEHLLSAIDDWAFTTLVLANNAHGEGDLIRFHDRREFGFRLLRIAKIADPDPWRCQVRDARRWKEPNFMRELSEELLRDVDKLRQTSPAMFSLVGLWLQATDNNGEAWLRIAQQRYPTDFWLNFELGTSLADGKPNEAVGFLRVALVRRPQKVEVHNALGAVHIKLKKYAIAMAYFQKSLALDPTFAMAHNNVGLVHLKQEKYKLAVKSINQAIQLDPKDAEFYTNLGNALAKLKQWKQSEQAYKNAIKANPGFTGAWYNLGHSHYDRKDYRRAENAFRRVTEINDKDAGAWNNLGNVLRMQKKLKEATHALSESLKLDPNSAKAHANLGLVYTAQRKFAHAEKAFQKSIAIDPDNETTHNNLGIAYFNQRNWDSAIASLRQAISMKKDYPIAWLNLGNSYKGAGDSKAAIAAYRVALKLKPKMFQPHFGLAYALLDVGEFKEAEMATIKAKQLLPFGHPGVRIVDAQLRQCRTLQILEKKLPKVLGGASAGAKEHLMLAEMCAQFLHRYQDAAALYAKAFHGDPQLTQDANKPYRYNAACAALRACSDDKKALAKDVQQKLRGQALAWLQADVKHRNALLNKSPLAAISLEKELNHWKSDKDLASVRGVEKIAGLPESERADWQQLWLDAETLLHQVKAAYTTTTYRGKLTETANSQVHIVPLKTGKTYIIEMRSKNLDSLLRLETSQGQLLDEKDDIDRRNRDARILFRPKKDGDYRVVAGSYRGLGRGRYEVVVQSFVDRSK